MMVNLGIFAELSLLLAAAALISFITRLLKQPLIIGHIATGLLVGPLLLNLVRSHDTMQLFSEIGVAFLLFIVGLNLTPYVIKEFGKVALLTGVGQVLLTSVAGYFISLALGFSPLTSLYISVALTFSSTIIILKLISDKGDLEKLYAKISIGFLLIQDLIAVLLVFLIPFFSASESSWSQIALTITKGILLVIIIFFISFRFLPKINTFLAKSQEVIFLFSIAWGMGLAALFKTIGFSLESGALIAGIALSALPSRHEISARLTPLRDFFIVIFFVLLGSRLSFDGLQLILLPALIFSALVLIGNPLILMAIMGAMGYRKKTSFQTGLTVAQISEFSLILIVLGVSLNHLQPEILSLVTLVGLITIFGSTYFVLYSEKIFKVIERYLGIFERKGMFEEKKEKKNYRFILFGYNRIGFDFLEVFKKRGKNFLVVDHDPNVIEQLNQNKIDNEYGDAGDICFLELINFQDAQMVVSTIPLLETNILILEKVKKQNPSTAIMVVAHNIKDALNLYEKGATYVIMPHFLGGKYASFLAENFDFDAEKFSQLRKEHLTYISLRSSLGHDHPVIKRFF
ncbi:MAG: cation:proton antiporter family protein [Patescibacteria group bacterium]